MKNNKPKIFKSWFMYDTEENRELLDVLEEIRKRDGWTFSRLVHEALKDWRVRHEVNPQMTLTKSIGEPKLKVECYCGRVATHEVWALNGWHGYLCSQDFSRSREHGLLKRWKPLGQV